MLDPELNKILKEMWVLDGKNLGGISLSEEEQDFYNKNLSTIKEYYKEQNQYWQSK